MRRAKTLKRCVFAKISPIYPPTSPSPLPTTIEIKDHRFYQRSSIFRSKNNCSQRRVFCTLSIFKTLISTWGKSKGKGGWPARGRVPGRTGRRSNCCGFAEVLGLSRAELYGMNIGFRDLKMTAWSFRTSLTKWDPLTRPGS